MYPAKELWAHDVDRGGVQDLGRGVSDSGVFLFSQQGDDGCETAAEDGLEGGSGYRRQSQEENPGCRYCGDAFIPEFVLE